MKAMTAIGTRTMTMTVYKLRCRPSAATAGRAQEPQPAAAACGQHNAIITAARISTRAFVVFRMLHLRCQPGSNSLQPG
jgi:hypothetical protein